jgi:RecA-family ATPase
VEDLNTDQLIARMEADELEGAEKMSPRDWARMRSISPQLVYYHIRQGHIKMEKCNCGRNVIDVEAADTFWKGKESKDKKPEEEGVT